MKKFLKIAGIAIGVLILVRLTVSMIWPTINDVTTGQTPQYADIQPQRFDRPPAQVFTATLAVAREMGWDVTETDSVRGEIHAVATTRVFKFKDDVTIWIAPDRRGTLVHVRSKSRVGLADYGTNARRIRKFQDLLSDKMAKAEK